MNKDDNSKIDFSFSRFFWGSLALILLSVVFVYFSMNRLVARDGGFYLMAAKLVAEGKELYRDFFYPQMPLLPHVYAAWGYFVGFTWVKARLLSAILTIMLGMLLFFELDRRYKPSIAFLGIVVFACCNMSFTWFSTVTTYPLATLLLFATYMCLSRKPHIFLTFLAGLFLGLTIETRLPLAALTPVFLLMIYTNVKDHKWLHIITFGVAVTIALLPAISMFVIDKDLFWYNNLGYHLTRNQYTYSETVLNRRTLFRVLFGLVSSHRNYTDQIPILVWGTMIFPLVWFIFRKRDKALKFEPAFFISVVIIAVYFTPKPSYLQYFSTLMPFLVIGVFASFWTLYRNFNKFGKVCLCLGVLALTPTYFNYKSLIQDTIAYTRTGHNVIGIGNQVRAHRWNLGNITAVSNAIDRYVEKGTVVFSCWPGFLIETKNAVLYPGTENHFSYQAAKALKDPELIKKYKLFSYDDLPALIRKKEIKLFQFRKPQPGPEIVSALAESGYVKKNEDLIFVLEDE